MDLTDDPKACMGGTTDVEIRFRIDLSSIGIKVRVGQIDTASFSKCMSAGLSLFAPQDMRSNA